jgi:hypothetical protein
MKILSPVYLSAREHLAFLGREMVERHQPLTVQKWHRRGKTLGLANAKSRIVYVPWRTDTAAKLYTLAHEVGHVVLNHHRRKPKYLRELGAEQWAHEALEQVGVPVSLDETLNAKANVADRIKRELNRGAKVDPRAQQR